MSTSYYGLDTATVDVSNSGNLTATGGGSSTTETPGTQTLNYNGYDWVAISFRGGVESIRGALPPTGEGHGWLLDDTSLEGQTISAGDWSALFTLVCSDSGAVGTLAAQFFKLDTSTAAFTLIGTAESAAGQNIGTTPTAFTLTATGIGAVTFDTGEKLYIELYWNQASGGSGTNLTSVQVASAADGVPGAAGGLEIQLPSGSSDVDGSATFIANSALVVTPQLGASAVVQANAQLSAGPATLVAQAIMQANSVLSAATAQLQATAQFVANALLQLVTNNPTHELFATFSRIGRLLTAFVRAQRLTASFTRYLMAQPNADIFVTATVTDHTHAPETTLTAVTCQVTFPDNTQTTYSLGAGITNQGNGQYQLYYQTKGAGTNTELWTFTATDGSTAQYKTLTQVSF